MCWEAKDAGVEPVSAEIRHVAGAGDGGAVEWDLAGKGRLRTCVEEAEPRVCLVAYRGWRILDPVLVVAGQLPFRNARWRVPWAGCPRIRT